MANLGILVQHSAGKLYLTFQHIRVEPAQSVFLRLLLKPGKHAELRTRSINTRKHKAFDETFTFFITKEKLKKKRLKIQLFGSKGKEEEFIGQTGLKFSSVDLSEGLETVLFFRKSSNSMSLNSDDDTTQTTQQLTNNSHLISSNSYNDSSQLTNSFTDNSFIESSLPQPWEIRNEQFEDNPNYTDAVQIEDKFIEDDHENSVEDMESTDTDSSVTEEPNQATDVQDLNRRLQQVFNLNRERVGGEVNLNLDDKSKKAAEEYVNMSANLSSLQYKIEEAEKENKKLEEKMETTLQKIDNRNTKIHELKNTIQNQTNICQDLENKVKEKTEKNIKNEEEIENLKGELHELENHIVEKLIQRKSSNVAKAFSEKLKNSSVSSMLDENPKLFSQLLEEEVEELEQAIDDLTERVTGNIKDLVEYHETLDEQVQKEYKKEASNSPMPEVEDAFDRESLQKMMEEKMKLTIDLREIQAEMAKEEMMHNSKLQAMDEAREFLINDFREMKKNCKTNVVFQEEGDKAIYHRLIDREVKRQEGMKGLKELEELLSVLHNSATIAQQEESSKNN